MSGTRLSQTIVTTIDENVNLANRTLHAIPPDTIIPTGSDAYTSLLWNSENGFAPTTTDKGFRVTINFPTGTKQFKLVVEGGVTYIDRIEVYF